MLGSPRGRIQVGCPVWGLSSQWRQLRAPQGNSSISDHSDFLKAIATECGKPPCNSCNILLILKLSVAILPTVFDKISVVQCKQNHAPGLWPKSPLASASSAQKTNLKGHLVTTHLAQTLKSLFSFTTSSLGTQLRTWFLHVFITLLTKSKSKSNCAFPYPQSSQPLLQDAMYL